MINPNDSAFPSAIPGQDYEFGMTKREYFAALALQGLAANIGVLDAAAKDAGDIPEVMADMALGAADALIAALNKG